MSTLLIVLCGAIIYLISAFLSYYLNKKIYKRKGLDPIVFAWLLPVMNTFSVIIFLILFLIYCKFFSSDYWKKKWDLFFKLPDNK
jgi:hypothetical protein